MIIYLSHEKINYLPSKNHMKLIVDIDTDYDDILALIYLLTHKNVDVVAITLTETGMIPLEDAIKYISSLLKLADKEDVVIGVGDNGPITPFNRSFPSLWRDEALQTLNRVFSRDGAQKDYRSMLSAVDLTAHIVRRYSGQVTILCLGPATNLASTVLKYPELYKSVDRVVIMGGAVLNHPGNVDMEIGYEYNTWLDPIALSIVTSSKLFIELVPLNATDCVPITDAILLSIPQGSNRLETIAREMIYGLRQPDNAEIVHFWDGLASLITVSSSKSVDKRTKSVVGKIRVSELGATKLKKYKNLDKGNVRCYLQADPEWFYRNFIDVIFK